MRGRMRAAECIGVAALQMRDSEWRRKGSSGYYGSYCHSPGIMKTVELDAYVLESLMPDLVGHDRAPSALLVFLYLWAETRGKSVAHAQRSLQDISSATGLSKRTVQDALSHLAKRRLIAVQRDSITAVPVYAVKRPWVR